MTTAMAAVTMVTSTVRTTVEHDDIWAPPRARPIHCDHPRLDRRSRARGPGRSGQVEAVELHHLGPRGDEVAHELLTRVLAGVHLAEGPQLRVGPEDEVHRGGGPPQVPGGVVADLVDVLLVRRD